MIEIRFHGRGGQGTVKSTQILAGAVIARGAYAQAFPAFGPERRGAPVMVYVRVSDRPIRNRTAICTPDIVVVLEPALIDLVPVEHGLGPGGTMVLNWHEDVAALREKRGLAGRLAVVDANAIARAEIGRVITNTVMLGALVRSTRIADPDAVIEAIREGLGRHGPPNVKAFERAFEEVRVYEAVGTGAVAASGVPRSAAGAATAGVPAAQSSRPRWSELAVACSIVVPGSARHNRTGDWRSSRPIWKHDKCAKCGLCAVSCPEGCIVGGGDGHPVVDLEYCKGCGICVHECRRGCIAKSEEA